MPLEPLGVEQQLDTWDHYVNDPRGAVPSGIPALDSFLEGGGFGAGELVLLGGRTGTRKTSVALNLVWNMVRSGTAVAWVGLDESDPRYVAKLFSAMSGVSTREIRERWDEDLGADLETRFKQEAEGFLVLGKGVSPTTQELDSFLVTAEIQHHVTPQVVFIDYLTLLHRDKYEGGDVNRIPRLTERLQQWTHQREVVTICIHQVARYDEGMGAKYHGERPMTIEGLKYGGEEYADLVLATYRPSKDPVGLAEWDAVRVAHPKMQYEEWKRRRARVDHYRQHTFLQLLKNRPGEDPDGFETLLKSVGKSMQMLPDPDYEKPWKHHDLEDDFLLKEDKDWRGRSPLLNDALDLLRAYGDPGGKDAQRAET